MKFIIALLVAIVLCGATAVVVSAEQQQDSLLIPALLKFVSDYHSSNQTTDIVEFKNKYNSQCGHCPCTACLQCCLMRDLLEEKNEKMANAAQLIANVDYFCPCTACPLQCSLRGVVSSSLTTKAKQVLNKLDMNGQEGTLDFEIKKILVKNTNELMNNNNKNREEAKSATQSEDNLNLFMDKLVNCPCTACPLQCSLRKMMISSN
jgi:hypothetical protein